ncbi:hypothetical protein CRG98_007030 [Punica granatum]|uniref:Uncharacterized protein n=1 Tax=Punica granatum TaxID=22663 RepID=A0A2I0KWA8_PUNGR|nr:hypothetical protein CRG98_007030 [Punica granatum]
MEEARFAYADIYKPLMDIIQNPYGEGFDVSAEGCCGTGLVETGPLCLVLTPKCIDPSRYRWIASSGSHWPVMPGID